MSKALWTFAEVLAATGGKAEGAGAPDMGSVSIDSRTVEKGALFVAIRGDNQDGHKYVGSAFGAGAAAALVEEAAGSGAGPLIRVADTLEALNRLGAAARARTQARVIAVTGSVGKTGTKEALRMALAPSGSVHASIKSYNNHWGVPLTLANMAREIRYAVVEIGMNHAGEITPLTKLARPHIAIVTTVEPVHLEFFPSVEAIADAKAEIFLGLERDGAAVLNIDNAHFSRLSDRARQAGAGCIVSFGTSDKALARLLTLAELPEGSDIEADILGRRIRYRLGASGKHLAVNSLAVLAAVSLAGADVEAAARALADYRAPQGRGARSRFRTGGGEVVLIDESYNANPASMRAALAALGVVGAGAGTRRIAVLGDMLELGHSSEELHRGLADAVDASGADVVFACGPHMRALFEAIPAARRGAWEATAELLQPRVLAEIRAGDVVMIKGSLGSRMGPIVEALRGRLSAAV